MQQHTVKREFSIEGKGLHSGKKSLLRVRPADPGSGIIFQRSDLSEASKIKAHPENVVSSRRSVDLGIDGESLVGSVEHFLAACAGMSINNLLVDISGPEIPALDGSAAPLVERFSQAGQLRQSEKLSVYRPEKRLEVKGDESRVLVEPADEFSLHYRLDFGDHAPGQEEMAFFPGKDNFARRIAPARTFVRKCDIAALREAGLARGGSRENAVVFTREGPENELRFSREAARHKILDLLGDLFLLPLIYIQARITGDKSGHDLHCRLGKIIFNRLREESKYERALRR